MGVYFGENASNYLQVTDSSVLTLPNSDWCIAMWLSSGPVPGSLYQYFYSTGSFLAANTVQLYFNESGLDADTQLVASIANSSGTAIASGLAISGALTHDYTRWLVVVQRNGNNLEAKIASQYASSLLADTSTACSNWTALNPPEAEIGRRADGNADRAYEGNVGHVFQGNFILSDAEVLAMASGKFPWELGYTPNFYLPLTSNVATQPDLIGGLTVTRNGTLGQGVGFPPDLRGFMGGAIVYTPAAGGATVPHNPFGHVFLGSFGGPV